MTGQAAPTVSVGMPVYNGEAYLERALDTLLAQEWPDFELVVSDNASTDATPDILARYAARDPRVRVVRQSHNLGAAPNYNAVFRLSRGHYFKWAAADDEHEPGYLSACVDILERCPDVTIAHARTVDIDEHGVPIRHWTPEPALASADRTERVRALVVGDYDCLEVFGLMRREELGSTRLHGAYPEADHVILVEMAMRGRMVSVDRELFRRRDHADRSVRKFPSPRLRVAWFDASRAGRIPLPAWRLGREYVRAVHEAPVPVAERWRCYLVLRGWLAHNWRRLLRNLVRWGIEHVAVARVRRAARLSTAPAGDAGAGEGDYTGADPAGVEPPTESRARTSSIVRAAVDQE